MQILPIVTTLILSSSADPASSNIKNFLLKLEGWEEEKISSNKIYRSETLDAIIFTVNASLIRQENIDREIISKTNTDFDQMIVISGHRSETGKPTLSTHPVGNFGKAEFGGRDRTLVKTSPKLMTELLRLLKTHADNSNLYHDVCFEVTHHGPYVEIPTLFVEVGSDEREWKNEIPAKTVARAVIDLLKRYKSESDFPEDIPVLVGIGGGHYAPRFTELAFEQRVAFGHMIPSYQIERGVIDEEIINKCIEATPGCRGVYIHRKGLKKRHLREVEKILRDMGVEIFRSENLPPLS